MAGPVLESFHTRPQSADDPPERYSLSKRLQIISGPRSVCL